MSPDTPQASDRRAFIRRGSWYRPASVPRILLKTPSNPPSPPPDRRTGLKLRRSTSRKTKTGTTQKGGQGEIRGSRGRYSRLGIQPDSGTRGRNQDAVIHRGYNSPVSKIKGRNEFDNYRPNDENDDNRALKFRRLERGEKSDRASKSGEEHRTLRNSQGEHAQKLHMSPGGMKESWTNEINLQLQASSTEATLTKGLDKYQPPAEIGDEDGRELYNPGEEERGGEDWPDTLPVSPITARDIQLYIDPGRDGRAKLERLLKGSSIVQAKKSQKLPKVYQHTQKIRHKVNQDYNFPCPSVRDTFPHLVPQVESLQTKRKRLTTPSPVPMPGETTASDSFPSLPKTPYGTFLLRRPTTGQPRPIVEEDDVFQNFANRLDLKPLLINDSPSKTLKFYAYHYPLLLHKLLEEDKDKYVDRRSITPSLGPDGKKRGAEIGKRLMVSNKALDELDKQTTDIRFYTELRDLTFDPRRWVFNLTRYN